MTKQQEEAAGTETFTIYLCQAKGKLIFLASSPTSIS